MHHRARLVVAVQSAHGAPIEGATIELRAPWGGEPRALARTDRAGQSMADDLTPGSYELRVLRRQGEADVAVDHRTVYLDAGRNTVSLRLRGEQPPSWELPI